MQDNGDAAAADSSVGFALSELIACWNQAHEAMTRGDLQSVTELLDQSDVQVAAAGDGTDDTPDEAHLRMRASTTYGLLQHAMKSGLNGIRSQLGKTRRGAKVLRGYSHAASNVGEKLAKSC